MTWKKVLNSDAGTATKHGGNDIDKMADAFNGVDVSDPIKYNTDINTLYASTNAAGDLLKSNGTKFVRLPRGTANQVLGVNAGGTDIAWTAAGAGGGEANTAANVGTGTGTIFRDKTSVTLNLKTLLAGTNVTLTNNANDITIAATPGGGGGDVSTTSTNTYGDFDQVFRSGRLDVRNPANTFSYSITGSAIAANRALTLPLLTADDTAVTQAFTQTLTNKTIDADSNTITNIENADIKAAAAIAKSKLANLDIVNADVNASAAIAKTKLANLDVVNADVNASAAIAWTKLNKTGSAINDLDDVTITTPSNTQVLTYNGTVWVNSAAGGGGGALAGVPYKAYDYTIYRDGSTYYSIKQDGTTLTSGSTAETVINTTFTQAVTDDTFNKSIYIMSGVYDMSGAFTGLNFRARFTNLIFAPGVIIRCPNAYTGIVLKCEPTATRYFINSRIIGNGCRFDEAGAAAKDWTGLQFNVPTSGTQQGIQNNYVEGITFINANLALELKCQRDVGWNNSNMFRSLTFQDCNKGINFDQTVTRVAIGQSPFDTTGFNRNTFSDILFQPIMDSSQLDQIDNVKHDNNLFHNMQTADVDPVANAIHITADANFTTLSGTMLPTYKRWMNESATTIISGGDEGVRGPWVDGCRNTGWINTHSASTAVGSFDGHTQITTPTLAVDNISHHRIYQTTATSGTVCGFRVAANFRVDQFPAIRTTFQTSETTNNRLFIGFLSDSAQQPAADTIPDNKFAIGFGFRPADTTWRLVRNDNTGGGEWWDTGIARTANVCELKWCFMNTRDMFWRISTNNTAATKHLDMWHGWPPSDNCAGQNMAFHFVLSNSAAENKTLKIWKCKIWSGYDS